MRETSFIKQNKKKWKEFERILENKNKDPDKLNELFVQITDDLSYSRTFYPNRSVRVYLNNLAQRIFSSIYKNKQSRKNRFFQFWSQELPTLVYEARSEFRLSLIIFSLAFFIGAFSSAMDPEFPRVILGDSYVEMTLENIQSGDPMRVYKSKGQFGMSLGITANNLYVAFLTFVLGAFFGIGAVIIMVSNGIMVGAFQYFFYTEGLLQESFLTIWIHGTLEISAIIIAGAAGMTMGRGLLFPGTYRRVQAFQVSAKRGIKIMLGITPIIIAAGFIEGFLTRHTETPDAIRLAFILICLFFIIGYFVWYPIIIAKTSNRRIKVEEKVAPDNFTQIDFQKIYSPGEIFSNIFVLYRQYWTKALWMAVSGTIVYCLISFITADVLPDDLYGYSSGLTGGASQLFYNEQLPWLPLIVIPILSLIALLIFYSVHFLAINKPLKLSSIQFFTGLLKVMVPLSIFYYLYSFADQLWKDTSLENTFGFELFLGLFVICCIALVFPILFLSAYSSVTEKTNSVAGIGKTFNLLHGNYGSTFLLYFILLLLGYLFYALSDTALVVFYYEFIGWNLALEKETLDQVSSILLTSINLFIWLLVYNMLVIGITILYYTLTEISSAKGLSAAAAQIGLGKRIRGIEQEG